MFKVAWFARFREGISNEDGRRYWAGQHAALAGATTIERYVQSHVTGPVPAQEAEEATFFDGYSLGWWSDRRAFEATMASPEWQLVAADGPNVFDVAWLAGMSGEVREHTVIEGPSSPFKVVWVCRFKAGIDNAAAHAHWENVHGPIFKQLDIDRYVQNHVVGPAGEGAAMPGFDGFSECWFADEAQFRRAIESDAWAAAVLDGESFLDFSQLWGAVLLERTIKDDRELAAV